MKQMKKNIFVILIIGLLLLTISPTSGLINEIGSHIDRTKLDEVREAILEANAQWIAEYTSVSNSSYLVTACCNIQIGERDDNSFTDVLSPFSLPSEFDWRNVGGTDWTTSIKTQGDCASCIAFAAVAALESVVQIEIGQPFECDLSEAHLFFCGGGSCTRGWNLGSAANFISSVGVADELCFSYNPYQMKCDEKEPNWQNRTVSAKYKTFPSTHTTSVKQALIEYGPLMTFFNAHYDLYYYREGIYEHVWGLFSALHAITIVGYNDIDGYWICKNSWGENWGEKNPYDSESNGGWFRIKYGECSIGTSGFFAFYDFSGNVHPSKPTGLHPINGQQDVEPDGLLSWSCYDPDGDELFFNIYLSKNETVLPTEEYLVAERINEAFYPLDTLDLKKNSKYSWIVVAEDIHGSKSMSDTFTFITRKLYEPYLTGPSRIRIGEEYTFIASTPESTGDEYYWFFDWGDGSHSDWIGPYGADDEISQSHTWNQRGDVTVKVKYQEDGIDSEYTTMSLPVRKSQLMSTWFNQLFKEYTQMVSLLEQLLVL